MFPKTALATLITVGFGLAPLCAQTGTPETPSKTEAQAPQAGVAQKDIAGWIQGLGDSSYKVRVDAEKSLRAAGKEALPELQKAAEGSKDAEVQWRARRLVRQIEHGQDGSGLQQRKKALQPLRQDQPDAPGVPDMRLRFDDLFKQLERDFGVDIPTHRFFQDDFFQDLRGQMDSLRQQMQQMQQGTTAESRGMSMQIGADGAVKVELKTKNDKGEEETKTYEAPDLQSFQQKYPGVLEQQGFGGVRFWTNNGNGQMPGFPGLRLRGGNALPFQHPQIPDQDNTLSPADQAPPPSDKRLGVLIRNEIPQDVREYLGLKAGAGLMVEQVQDDTLAAELGVQPDDIVLKINDHAIGTAGDVQDALGAIAAGDKVEVEILRKGRSMTLTGKKPAAAAEPAPKQLRLRKMK